MRKCPVCGTAQADALGGVKLELPAGCPLPGQYQILRCDHCGMCYADTAASEVDYDNYYQVFNWYGGSGKSNTPVVRWTKIVEDILPKTAKILDIGFGTGLFLSCLKQSGFQNVSGIDPSKESVQALQARGITANIGSVYHLQEEQKFDLIIFSGVLEHLLFPERAITQIVRSLKPGGRLFLSFPDYSAIAHSDFPMPHFFNQEHINYFSVASLNRLMSSYSLQLEYKDLGGDCEYDDFVAIYRLPPDRVSASSLSLEVDYATSQAIETYINRAEYNLAKAYEVIHCLKTEGQTVWIWGCGAYLGYLLANTELVSCQIAGFIDSNPIKKDWECIPNKGIYPQLPKSVHMQEDHTVLITSMGGHEAIREQLVKMGHQGPIIIL